MTKTVHFVIAARDEWGWDHGGWTERAGTYQIYVGDSSASVDLPLTARYEMRQPIGVRQVTVSTPELFKPGTRTVVCVSLSAGGNETLSGVNLGLVAPAGWQVVPLDRTTRHEVAPDEVLTAKFAVTPPSWAVAQYVTLYGTADPSHGACSGARRCGAARRGGKTVLVGP